jgi:hypothetical protein
MNPTLLELHLLGSDRGVRTESKADSGKERAGGRE